MKNLNRITIILSAALCLMLGRFAPQYVSFAATDVISETTAEHAADSGSDIQTGFADWKRDLPKDEILPIVEVRAEYPGDTVDEYLEYRGEYPDEVKQPNSSYANKDTGYSTYGYDQLTAAQQSLYDSLKVSSEAFINSSSYDKDITSENEAKIDGVYKGGELALSDLLKVFFAFRYDNPQYYWLDNKYSYGFKADGGILSLYIDTYYYSSLNRKTADDAIEALAPDWVKQVRAVKASEGDYSAVVCAHDLILNRIDYAYDNKGHAEQSRWAHCLAGVFTQQGVVCEGYAKAFQYLLNMADIDNIYIVGTAVQGASTEGHAWNCVLIDGKYWLVDATWDDANNGTSDFNEAEYLYFCLPESKFSLSHIPDNMGYEGMYDLPETYGDTFEKTYYYVYGGYSAETLTNETAKDLVDRAKEMKPERADYLHFAVPDPDSVYKLAVALGKREFSYNANDIFGCVSKFESIDVGNPAKTVSLSVSSAAISVGESVKITAILPEGSDDRVLWTIDDTSAARLTSEGLTATVYGKRNGDVRLTAKTYSGGAEAYCDIVVGEGSLYSDATVWQNGKKDYKTFALSTTLTATSWTNEKGKTKQGKLIWIASDTDMVPTFDSVKHSLTNKPKPTIGKVNNKGIVSAKKAGRLYVFACDTGSCTYEKFVVEILGSPSKLYLTKTPGSTEKTDILKKVGLTAGTTGKVYITPFIKEGEADLANDYTVELAKEEYSSLAKVSEVKKDDDGNAYFTVTALDFNREKGKTASVKINVFCEQSGKKASMTIVVYNPVKAVNVTSASGATVTSGSSISLANKKDTATLNIGLTTALSGVDKTTDKLKVYIGKSRVELNSKGKPEADKGATVKGKLDVKTMTLTLKASKDAGATAVIKLGCTNSVTKETDLFTIGTVDESGILTLK